MILAILLSLFSSWFVMRWYLGNTLAEYFNPEEARMDTARTAVSLAPNDPLTHWRLANYLHKQRPPDEIFQAVSEYEKAVSLSPNDYRYWMELGEALEQAGEHERAEKALREAVRLAPSYAYPRWYLGNLLVRIDRYEEAFEQLRRASEANNEFQPQLFNLAWQLNKDDFQSMVNAIGPGSATRAKFAEYLVARSRFDEGLRLWNTLSDAEKRENRESAESLVASLVKLKRFHTAVEIWNSIAPSPSYHAHIGKFMDPGFENNIAHGETNPFSWQVPTLQQVQIGITPSLGHSGSRSLRVFFQVRTNLDGMPLSQLVPVQPNTQYNFECFIRTEKLVSASTPLIGLDDALTDIPLAISAAAPSANNDWQRITLSVKSGPKTEALRLKVYRGGCGAESPVCPIFGTVWYDDFDLKPAK